VQAVYCHSFGAAVVCMFSWKYRSTARIVCTLQIAKYYRKARHRREKNDLVIWNHVVSIHVTGNIIYNAIATLSFRSSNRSFHDPSNATVECGPSISACFNS